MKEHGRLSRFFYCFVNDVFIINDCIEKKNKRKQKIIELLSKRKNNCDLKTRTQESFAIRFVLHLKTTQVNFETI